MDDSSLLELAGKAAGEAYGPDRNPLERDDLALRLAVKLGLLHLDDLNVDCALVDDRHDFQADPYAATRLAIVRAAAEIGRQMP